MKHKFLEVVAISPASCALAALPSQSRCFHRMNSTSRPISCPALIAAIQYTNRLSYITGSIFLLFFALGCGSTGVSSRARTMEVTVFVPANPQAYGEMITGEQDFQRAAAMPFVKKHVVVPYSKHLLHASANAAAREAGPTQMGPATIIYLKIENGTAYALLNIDRDGWAGVGYSRAYCHPIVEKTLLQFKRIKRVIWDEASGEDRYMMVAPNTALEPTPTAR